ncbi:MAG: hypothetical protein Hyperionvirus14_29 [Hyperionvirus sp.]|uniref:Uncharacterized protein n=1 Tax=Hyperionvirus sp. TaxID=2487770 RepID=A0A3G5A9K5_9VIRU|nr:MAG: hypothetical protein Hyperionvirus14_29 [Hyperionvirus sp.]
MAGKISNALLFEKINELGKLNYFERRKMEILIKGKVEIWESLSKGATGEMVAFCFVYGPKVFRTVELLERAYRKGERFYSGWFLGKQGGESKFKERRMGYLRESCEANNPKALEMYVRYLQMELGEWGRARVQIRKLLELGETRTELANEEFGFDYAGEAELGDLKRVGIIVREAVEMFVSVEMLIERKVIGRENEVWEYNPDPVRLGCGGGFEKVVTQFDAHHLLLLGLLKGALDRHRGEMVKILKGYLKNKYVAAMISYAVGTHYVYEGDVKIYTVDRVEDSYGYIFQAARAGYSPALEYLTKNDPRSDKHQKVLRAKFLETLQLMPPIIIKN